MWISRFLVFRSSLLDRLDYFQRSGTKADSDHSLITILRMQISVFRFTIVKFPSQNPFFGVRRFSSLNTTPNRGNIPNILLKR